MLAVLLLQSLSGFAQAGNVRITELMAINNSTLRDEDGSYSDWLELYNAGTDPVDLGGWYLANSAANLTKWQFPATNLGPNQFLIVFASDKNRRVPGAPLHTNFKLSGSGEYLALVLPDGVTKASEFAPAFPPQYPDISYGYLMTGVVSTLIAPVASARAFIPVSDIGTGWRFAGFNDTGWAVGVLGAGFDTSGNYASSIGLDVRAAMLGVNASAYLRVPFSVADPTAYNSLALRLRYDDGFVAFLNGTEVAKRNAPGATSWNSNATGVHGAPAPGFVAEGFEGAAENFYLSQHAMDPMPAIQPSDSGSTGRFLRLLHDEVNNAANSVAFRQTAPGLFQTIESEFDFRITSGVNNPADGFCFMLIPTAMYGTNGPGVNTGIMAAEEPNYQGVFAVGFDVYPHTVNNDVSLHWGGSEVVNVTIPTAKLDLAAGVFHHARISLQHVTGGARVTVTLTPNINGKPGKEYSPITNLFITELNPFECRAQFGGRTGGLNLGLDIDNVNIQFTPAVGPVAYEDFDISPFREALLAGANMLAIQGLNVSATNSNFLIQPELLGRRLSLAAVPGFLYPATPGSWNDTAAALAVPEVSFWPHPGVWASNTLAVSLACSSSSGTIRYTLDGSTPGVSSLVYTNPIVLTTTATVRAQADQEGFLGEIASASYYLLDSTVTNFTSNLPLVIIDTLGQVIPDGTKVGAYARFIGTNTPTGRASLISPADYSGRLAIGLHGNSSVGFPKKPYAIELQDESGDDLDSELLGMPAHSDWLLYPSYNDKTLMNNVLTQEIFESMGHYAVRRRYVELFVHRTSGRLTYGDYQGIYVLLERIRVDKNRLDLTTLGGSDNTPPAVTGGYLFEKDRPEVTDLTFTTSTGQQLIILYPKADKITPAQYEYLSSYVNLLEAALYGPNWRDPITGYAAYLDVDSFVDYHWMVEYPKNIDGVRLSNHLHKDRNGKIRDEPIWDWDLSWGNANYAEGGKTNGWYYTLMGGGDDMWLSKLRTDTDFYQKIIDRWGELRSGVFNPSNLLARIDQITSYLQEAQVREFNCWPRLGTYVWPNPDGVAGGWDVDYVSPTTYAGIIAQFKKYIRGRFEWIDQQFLAAPTLTTNGSMLSLSAPLGSVYYTLDGTDPRASGGGLNPAARLYTGPVTLTSNAGIFARVMHVNAWSSPVRAVYVTGMPSLRITEINYHPAAAPADSPYSEEDFEFLEIQNTGTNIINLAGAQLDGGIHFTFAPRELVPAGNPTTNAFEGSGTSFVASKLDQNPGPYLTNGPSGNLIALLNSTTNTTRNRLTFQQTAPTNYDRVVADFDFCALTATPASVNLPPTVQDFDSTGTAYTLAGSGPPMVLPADVGSAGSFLRLVPASGSQSGRVAFDRTASGGVGTVVANFDFRVTPPSEQNQADGFGFALLSTAAYSTSGSGPGISEGPNLTGSIGVGFDVYNNGPTAAEPNNNHLSLHWNGAQIGNGVTPAFDFSNGKFHRAQVIIAFSANSAFVTVRLTADINGTPGPTETVFQNVQITGVAPYEGRVAFGARTGGAWAAHDLDNVDVQFTANNIMKASGLSLLFLPSSQFGVTGAGTTLSTFTDQPMAANTLALDLAFNPSNLVNDVSLYWNAALARTVSLATNLADLDAGRFLHVRLQLDAAANGVYATLDLTPDSLGTPGAPINVISNYLIDGARLDSSRLEFAARNGGLSSRVEIDNVLARFQVLEPMVLGPGESILVVGNQAAFNSRYGVGMRIAGEYTGRLSNDGEQLILFGPLGEPILDFRYDAAWYPITDGAGFSLVVVDPALPSQRWGEPGNWRPSGEPLGSPGGVDSPPMVVAPVIVNEVLAYPVPSAMDRVELYNPNLTNVNIGGWYLSDSFTRPQKFKIPDNVWIPAGGFAVFTENEFNSGSAANAFALDGEGDDLWLFSADTSGQLTGYAHGFDFGASDAGVSFGRYLTSHGHEHFVAQTSNSFDFANSGPLVGPVVISEIMYSPPPTGGNTNEFLEYIELQNVSSGSVGLYNANFPARTWHLRDAVAYDFPAGVALDNGERLLVVGFDPVADAAGLNAFRTFYQLATNVIVLGPWQGRLSDSDERIELRKPGQMTASGDVPSVLVEAVHYRSTIPWPASAAGQGSSLQRRALKGYGNDPANWLADGFSPGAANPVNEPPLVAVTAPVEGEVVIYPDGAWIRSVAIDSDGSVVKMEFFSDTSKLGEVTNAPYSLFWTNPPMGGHNLTAAAWDNSGNVGYSAPVSFTVTAPSLATYFSTAGLELAWPSNSGNFNVQMTTDLMPPVQWSPVTNEPTFLQSYWRLHLSLLTNAASFYRLEAN